jgi:proteasome lid subunit RPN8/RPN11
MKTLILSSALQAQIEAEARAAWPRECCGLIEGSMVGGFATVTALHAVANMAGEADRFEINPAEQIRVLRTARAEGRSIIGCYHSHPNGRPEPSARDQDGASEESFVWLIAALSEPGPAMFAAFQFADGGFLPLAVAQFHLA